MAVDLYVEKKGEIILVEGVSHRAWYTLFDASGRDINRLKEDPEGYGWVISEKGLSKLIFVASEPLLIWN